MQSQKRKMSENVKSVELSRGNSDPEGLKRRKTSASTGYEQQNFSSAEEIETSYNDEADESLFDWNDISESWAGNECLFSNIPVSAISSLVGWATHFSRSRHDPTAGNTIVSQPKCGEGRNPFLFLSTAPLPPSCLQFVSDVAENMMRNESYQRWNITNDTVQWERHEYLAHGDLSDEEESSLKYKRNVPRWKKFKRKPWQEEKWTYSDEDDTYQLFCKSFKRTKAVETMMPKRTVRQTTNVCDGTSRENDAISGLSPLFDQSALVAIGMALDEVLTASLLPFARLHVDRCRKQELQKQSPTSESTVASSQNGLAFEWILPPAEALMRILCTSSELGRVNGELDAVNIPSSMPPSCVWRNATQFDSTPEASVSERLSRFASFTRRKRERNSISMWCKDHAFEPSFVKDNMDVFGLFLPSAPKPKGLELLGLSSSNTGN